MMTLYDQKKCVERGREIFHNELKLKVATKASWSTFFITPVPDADAEMSDAECPPYEDDSDEAKRRVAFDETEFAETGEDESASDAVESTGNDEAGAEEDAIGLA